MTHFGFKNVPESQKESMGMSGIVISFCVFWAEIPRQKMHANKAPQYGRCLALLQLPMTP
jgi:hypothetical protein